MRVLLLPLLFSLLLPTAPESVDQTRSLKLLLGMFDSIRQIKTMRTHIHAIERIEYNYNTADSEIKLQTHPRKLYFINRAKKLEVLYNSELSKKAAVKPHVFPYVTIHLDPLGNLMRKSQHYTIHELGFEFIAKTIALTMKNEKDKTAHFMYRGKVHKNGYSCHLLEFEDKNYGYEPYTVGEKETATSIAYRLCINEYLLRNKNDLFNDFSYLKKGRVLLVPSLYCKKAVLYIDEHRSLPVSISLFDDQGLFESYDFSQIMINESLHPEEFKQNYPGYGF